MRRASVLLAFVAGIALLGGCAGTAYAQGTPTAAEIPANLTPPASSVLLFALAARGDQIYACQADPNEYTKYVWTLQGPDAELRNARGEVVGSHFAGPTWQGLDGSAVVGAALERADSPETGAVPWLLLEAKDHEGSGVFSTVTYIQRLDTQGGVAPAEGCDETHADEEVRAPYEATYAFFYPASATAAGATPAAASGTVTVSVFSCPAELSATTGQPEPDLDTLLAGCTPLATSETAPAVLPYDGGEPLLGTMDEPGVYRWEDVPLGDYLLGGSGEMPPDLGAMALTDAAGNPFQNPFFQLEETMPDVELYIFYFAAEGTPEA